MKRFVLATVLFLLVSTLASCSIFLVEPEPPTPTPAPQNNQPVIATSVPNVSAPTLTPAAPPTTIPRTDLGQTRVYRDDIAGFELDVPSNWSFTPVGNEAMVNSVIYTATFHSWVPLGGGSEGIPDGETKIDITVYKNDAESPDAAFELRKQEFADAGLGQEISSQETWMLDNNLVATRLVVASRQGQAVEIVTAVNGKTILISGAGDYALVDAIARTFRQIPTSFNAP